MLARDFVMDPWPAEQARHNREQQIYKIHTTMNGEEIRADAQTERKNCPHRRMPGEPEVEQPPRPRDIAADRRIHEPREQGHAGDSEKCELGIDPRSRRRFENL